MRLMSITSFGSDDLFYSFISLKVRAFIVRDLSKISGNTEAVEKVFKREEASETRGGGMRSTSDKIELFLRF
jgi:hypothetical protein